MRCGHFGRYSDYRLIQNTFSVSGTGFSMSGTGLAYPFNGPCSRFGATICNAPGSYPFFDAINSEQTASGMSGFYAVDGVQTPYSCNPGTSCGGGIDFTGVVTLRDFGAAPPLTFIVTAPFTSTGGIDGVQIAPGQPAPTLSFTGAGIATIALTENSLANMSSPVPPMLLSPPRNRGRRAFRD